jgi:tetraacyldisaccharide 4'-kinase
VASHTVPNVILKITNRLFGIKRVLLLYRLLQFVFFPVIALYFLARLCGNRLYRAHFAERLGFLPRSFNPTKWRTIWLHAVSVGEVASALPLIRALRADQPLVCIYLSTSTVAGRAFAEKHVASEVNGIFYCPLDYASCVRRVLRCMKPSLLVVLETEIWPNLYAEVKASGAQLAIVNGRISSRTFPRYRTWCRFIGPILQLPDLILTQGPHDRLRYAQLGAPETKLSVAPNLKYDAAFLSRPVELDVFGAQNVWIAASTVGPNERGSIEKHLIDEDDLVLSAFETLAAEFPKLLLILAPRQPARFDAVASKLASRNLPFMRRTTMRVQPFAQLRLPGVLLLDTMGELSGLYRLADAVFVGGSLAPRGGHNILEPAAAGVPIVVGPHMENFAAITEDFLAAGALRQIASGDELVSAVRELFIDGRDFGPRALQLVETRRGTAEAIAQQLWPLFYAASLRNVYNIFVRSVLTPLAVLWSRGGALKRRQGGQFALAARPIAQPVISVGGLTVGGAGKTPFTVYLVKRLLARGLSPAILTRGYRRRSPAEFVILAPGTKISSAVTGDEAQIFLRSVAAPVGIGAKRYETAQILLRQFPETEILVLDDAFQHARIERTFDIVLIDGLDPFGGEEVVPLGRLREPLRALARADLFIVTRAEESLRYQAICRRLITLNPAAPVFRTRLVARSWQSYPDGKVLPNLPYRRVAAFCGLGNPANFWQTLESLGLELVFRWSFPDHHAYTPTELQRLAHQARVAGAGILLTTEKDRINCPNHLEHILAPLELAWLTIDLELENEPGFFEILDKALAQNQPKLFTPNA